MNSTTITIIAAVAVIWVILFIIFMNFNKKRKAGEDQFKKDHVDKALLHVYGKSVKVDGRDLDLVDHKTGQYGQLILALRPGAHTVEAVYRTTDNVGTQTKNAVTKPVSITIDLEAGQNYYAAMYFYSAEQRKDYYKGQVDELVTEVPLGLESGFTANTHAYVIVYKEIN